MTFEPKLTIYSHYAQIVCITKRLKKKRRDVRVWRWIVGKRLAGYGDDVILSALQWLEFSIDQHRTVNIGEFLEVQLAEGQK